MKPLVLIAPLLACSQPTPKPPAGPVEPVAIDEATWVPAVKGILPPGAVITRTTRHAVPHDWVTESPTGLAIEGRAGADTFEIVVLPRDWIGVRRPDPTRPRPNYWDGVLADDHVVTITTSTERTIPDQLRKLGMGSASIINGGWFATERAWNGRFAIAEAAAAHLLASCCTTPAARDEAAYSLIILGVPAANVFRRAAIEATGDARSFAISALANFPGDATARVVATVLRDPATTDLDRGYMGQVAETLADPAFGPALMDALGLTHDLDAEHRIASALGRLRYRPAAEAVLAAMIATDNESYKADFAGVLATLRHAAAVPEIQRLIAEPFAATGGTFSPEMELEIRDRARLALFVLTGDWGAPAGDLRVAIRAPATVALGAPVEVEIFLENVGDRTRSYFTAIGGDLIVDGVVHSQAPSVIDGNDSFEPTGVVVERKAIGTYLTTRGRHLVQYVTGGARSRELPIDVR